MSLTTDVSGPMSYEPGLRSLVNWSWQLDPGPHNAITDVPGVRVGHSTMSAPERGVCTGITVVSPADDVVTNPLPAAVHVINGYGKSVGLMQIEELGELESPIALTGVFGVPSVHGALLARLMDRYPDIGGETDGHSINAVVMECNDGHMHDPRAALPGRDELAEAFESSSATAVRQGTVGAGIGMTTFGLAGGVGTASRVLPGIDDGCHIGALVLSNFGTTEDLLVAGRPVGRMLPPASARQELAGSAIVVLATDLPMDSAQLKRTCRRVQSGLARTGCTTAGASGEVVIAFSTRLPSKDASTRLTRTQLDAVFRATAETVEEAVFNALCHAGPVRGRAGRTRDRLPTERLADLLRSVERAEIGFPPR